MQADAHDGLVLLIIAPMAHRTDWEKVSDLWWAYDPLLQRI
jgi:hypothetical protein